MLQGNGSCFFFLYTSSFSPACRAARTTGAARKKIQAAAKQSTINHETIFFFLDKNPTSPALRSSLRSLPRIRPSQPHPPRRTTAHTYRQRTLPLYRKAAPGFYRFHLAASKTSLTPTGAQTAMTNSPSAHSSFIQTYTHHETGNRLCYYCYALPFPA